VNKANFGKLAAGKTQGVEWTVESKQPQGRGESLVAQLDSAVNQANNSEMNKFSSNIAISWASTSKKRLSKSTVCNPAWRRR
jgi:hypothetical protein